MQQINSTPWKVIFSLCTSLLSIKWCLLQTSPPVFICISHFSWFLFGFVFWSIYLVFEGVNIMIGIVFLAGWFCWFILKSILCLNDIAAVHQKRYIHRKLIQSPKVCFFLLHTSSVKKLIRTPNTSALFLFSFSRCLFGFALWSMYLVFKGV